MITSICVLIAFVFLLVYLDYKDQQKRDSYLQRKEFDNRKGW